MSQKLLRSSVSIAAIFGVGLSAGALSVASAQAPTSRDSEEDIVITGSFIRGTPENAALPVEVIGVDEIQKSGLPNNVELIKALSVSNGVLGESNQFTSGRGQAAEGAGSINLRGLGASRTLVLLNGRRLAADDTNQIPMAALARIEILKDGAAATYGSDAIGGVVNFITRKSLNGIDVGANYRFVDGSQGDYDASFSAGAAGSNGNFLISGGYQYRADVAVLDRDWAHKDYADNPEGGWSGASSPTAFRPVTATGAQTGAVFLDATCAPLGGIVAGTTCRNQYTTWDCPSSDDLRHLSVFGKGGSGSSGLRSKRPAAGAASGDWRVSFV